MNKICRATGRNLIHNQEKTIPKF